MSTESTYRDRRARTWVAVIVLLFAYNVVSKIAARGGRTVEAPSHAPGPEPESPYQSEVEEGLGAAVAILIDTSGSMDQTAPGDSRPKWVVAQEALDAILDATDAFVAKRPDFPIKIGIYSFSSHARTLLAIRPYDRQAILAALARVPRPGGGTAIGEALRTARPDLYRAGVFRKYMLVVTDGENTSGRSPDEVARDIYQRSSGAVQMYFVAFDTSPQKFAFLREVGGNVFGAGSGAELRKALDEVYQGKILAEVPGEAE